MTTFHLTTASMVGAASLAMAGVANAADLEAPAYDPFKVYIGLFGGAVFADREVIYDPIPQNSVSDTFGTFGLLAGVNVRQDAFFYGAEGDFGWVLGDQSNNGPTFCTLFWCDADWKGHVRARVGVSAGAMDLFVAGGLAIADLGGADFSTTAVGWTIGGGVEGALSEALNWRVEVLYDEFEEGNIEPSGQYQGKWSDITARAALTFEF
jgi:outer membrane immunogenic protein